MSEYYFDSSMETLTDELLTELLIGFAAIRCWTDMEHHHQVAAEIIRQYLTVQFHAFVRQQISH